MTSISTEQSLMVLRENMTDAIRVAKRRGYELPPAHLSAQSVADAAATIRDEQPPAAPALPAKPKDVSQWVEDRAETLARHERQRTVAADLADRADRTAMQAMVDALPGYLAQVCDEFDQHHAAFGRLLTTAPRTVYGQMSGKEFELHAELLRAAEAMTIAAVDRAALAMMTGEQHDIGSNAMWLVLDPKPSTSIQAVRDTLTAFSGRFPQDVEEWARVDAIGCRMARGGEAAARVQLMSALTYASSTAPDGGLLDKTYAQALELGGDSIPRAFRSDPFAVETAVA